MARWPTSLRARLTLWYSVLLALPLVAFALASYLVVQRTLERRTDIFIGDALTAFTRELTAERRAMLDTTAAMRTTVAEVRFRDLHIAILDSTWQVVAMTAVAEEDDRNTSRLPSAEVEQALLDSVRAHPPADASARTIATRRGNVRLLTRPLSEGGQRYTVTGAYALQDIADVLERLRELFAIAVPALLAAAAIGGYLLARRNLQPLAAMSAQAAAIGVSNMHERLPVAGGDELSSLATVVNSLLHRLEASFEQQRRFVADASHELRTPTAVIRAEADITLSRAHRDEAEYRQSVVVMQDAARRLSRIVDDLFLLTRADAGHLVMRPAPLYLDELVHETARAVRSVATQRGIAVDAHDVAEAPMTGDADLLGRLLLNLLDNAIRYSPEGGQVQVTLTATRDAYVVTVTDAGPGIPADARERIFDRFYRVDTARSRSETSATSGAGLGLAIVRRIAEMHGGTITLADSRPGHTQFVLSLPTTARTAAPAPSGTSVALAAAQ